MKFGPVPLDEAEGAILAHSVSAGGHVVRKGTRLDRADLASLAGAGIGEIVVARLEAADVHEDEAARRLADAVAGPGISVAPAFTGRSNLHSEAAGVVVVDGDVIDRINAVDPSITIATLAAYAPVENGRMVATVKIIPFAVPREKLGAAIALAKGALRVAPFRPLRVGLVATTLPSLKPSVLDKTRRLLDVRLSVAGASVIDEKRVAHDAAAVGAALRELKSAGADLMIVFGASATVDEHDSVPAGIEAAGGGLIHFGMPVDPGNLLVLGALGDIPVVGAPGCARSPKENGFDWILNRLLAGLQVDSRELTRLGVGGLLMEIVSRPQPREGGGPAPDRRPKIAAVVLAAGQSRRMGGPNKLIATIGGKPLVRIATEAALGAEGVSSVTVVTGHQRDEVEVALAGLDVAYVENPHFAEGLSTSIRTGIAHLPSDTDGAIVVLGDMPRITPEIIDRLIGAFDPERGVLVVVPTNKGKRGNPVLWSSRFYEELKAVQGDTGGRHLIGANPDAVVEVEIGPEVGLDVDTHAALAEAGGAPA